ncbi:DNA-processing protein DprA [Caldisalinibacter kiritimatiensis]|uniref:Rossmann fold nucleotide-binding protein Smf possibly involved in DNA uptake n=1 Tax=Caldisalinibacter kiritimatiensis TaxID=1304284 RepID=R1CKR1_9FIRM|nr:DNA-processing protein DprA [Caldisalinibacter kiritimatiensis]EOC99315.1 Rossmann fold nucleotide-binding protein Smf possibly involved in DNA uptake [Caldisalinibacter kiritimatiensis]
MDNKDILIWLNSINGIGNKMIDNLIKYYGDLKSIWEAKESSIREFKGLNNQIKSKMLATRDKTYVEMLKKRIKELKIKVISICDNEYPSILKNIYDPPKILFVKGSIVKKDSFSIAIVGSRKTTPYGKWAADKFARELSRMGITIVSGMARGIDTISHKGALKENGRTIAVLGSGINVIYPKSNKELYNQIINNGAIISEFPIDMQPVAHNFPMRNRIISGLCLGVIVIEAKKKSGSLITAQHALEQGRDVFALPGNINSVYSKGTNLLIKDGAKLLTDVDDILEEINILKSIFEKVENKQINNRELGKDESKVLEILSERPMNSDIIASKINIDISKVNSILTILEMKGLVKLLPGNLYTVQ